MLVIKAKRVPLSLHFGHYCFCAMYTLFWIFQCNNGSLYHTFPKEITFLLSVKYGHYPTAVLHLLKINCLPLSPFIVGTLELYCKNRIYIPIYIYIHTCIWTHISMSQSWVHLMFCLLIDCTQCKSYSEWGVKHQGCF